MAESADGPEYTIRRVETPLPDTAAGAKKYLLDLAGSFPTMPPEHYLPVPVGVLRALGRPPDEPPLAAASGELAGDDLAGWEQVRQAQAAHVAGPHRLADGSLCAICAHTTDEEAPS